MQINTAASAPPHVFIRRNRSRGGQTPYNVVSCKLVSPRPCNKRRRNYKLRLDLAGSRLHRRVIKLFLYNTTGRRDTYHLPISLYLLIVHAHARTCELHTRRYIDETTHAVLKRRSLKNRVFFLFLFFYFFTFISASSCSLLAEASPPHPLSSYHDFVRWTGDNAPFVCHRNTPRLREIDSLWSMAFDRDINRCVKFRHCN